jgi:hypothetical protein
VQKREIKEGQSLRDLEIQVELQSFITMKFPKQGVGKHHPKKEYFLYHTEKEKS